MRIRKAEYATLAELLRQFRVDAKLTQTDIAAFLQVPQSFVSKYESGERRLDVLELRRICAVLDISVGEVIGKLESLLPPSN